MKLSTRTTYGLKALGVLVANSKRSVSLSEIADQEGISVKYLEAIFARLKQSGIVTAGRGAGGGYQLSAKPAKISIKQVFVSLEGKETLASCKANDKDRFCSGACHCRVNRIVMELNKTVDRSLSKLTLEDLKK